MPTVSSFDYPSWKANRAKKAGVPEHVITYYTDMLMRDFNAEVDLPSNVGDYLASKGVAGYVEGGKDFTHIEALFKELTKKPEPKAEKAETILAHKPKKSK